MDYQNTQQYSNQLADQMSELSPLTLRNFLGLEDQNAFSYAPHYQASQMFPYSNSMENAWEGYTWPAQDIQLNHITESSEPLQIQKGVRLPNALAGHAADDQSLGQVGPSFEDKFTLLEERISGLEVVIRELRNELQEKMRFFSDMEAYIKKLVAWTKESKDAVDNLVEDLKKAVEMVASK